MEKVLNPRNPFFQMPVVASKKVYIVYLGGHHHGKQATTDDYDRAIYSHQQFVRPFLKCKERARQVIIHSYTKHINGFAAYLDEEEAAQISEHLDVVSVFPSRLRQLHTTRTWDFLGLERNGFVPPASIWTKANYGKDVIIAHLDTGVWPESASFNDDGMGEIPAKWKGSCENSTKSGVVCNRSLLGTISAGKTVIGVKPAPVLATFSSRGPNRIAPQFLKPDITAPGVNVLASFSEVAPISESKYNTRRWPFNLLSGTSMSCPHVAGIMGLLRKLYPHWSPAAIRSAIMTTARTRDNTGKAMKDEDTGRKATPFAYGAGHIQPNRAMDPGLVYDMGIEDYLNFICSLGYNSTQMLKLTGKPHACSKIKMVVENMNNPSFAIPSLNKTMTVTRTLKNVGSPGVYRVRIKAPKGILVSVEPQVLQFKEVGEEKEFKACFKSTKGRVGKGYSFGMLIWSDGKHFVRSPMAVNATS